MARSHGLTVATLLLRLLALALLAASVALIATAKIYAPFDDVVAPPNYTFQDTYAYQYLLSAGVIGGAYTLIAVVFAAINVARRKMAGGGEGGTVLLICADVVFSLVIATGAAAALGYAVERQRYELSFLDSPAGAALRNFYDHVNASCALLLVAALCTAAIIMISAYSLNN